MNPYLFLWRLVKPQLPLLFLSLLGSLLYSAGTAGLTLTVKRVVDELFILKEGEVLKVALLLFGYGLLAQTGFFLSSYAVAYSAERVARELREKVFEKLLKSPLNLLYASTSGDLISRTVGDVEALRNLVAEHAPKLLREPLAVVALFAVLLYRDAYLTLHLLLFAPLLYAITRYFSEKKKKHLKRQREEVARLTSLLAESFRGIENIKLFLAERKFLRRFKEVSRAFFRASVKLHLYVLGNSFLNYLFGYAVVALFLLLGSKRIAEGHITPGDFVSYLTALFMLQKPLMDLQKALMNVRGSAPLFERIEYLLNLPEEREGDLPFGKVEEKIEFKGVSVKAGEKYLLRGINLTVKRGDKVGIKGPTGSGKSTFLRILPRLLEYEGEVLVDGRELRSFKLSSLRSKLSFATQEPFLFKGTVRENLLIAKPDATEEELVRSLELALCHFVLNSPYGLDYPVEEGGKNLSGGERQRLGLARVFLRGGEVVLLDEPTSALDPETEAKVIKNLFEVFQEKTLFIVAHRESNLESCNLIAVFSEGTVKEVRRL